MLRIVRRNRAILGLCTVLYRTHRLSKDYHGTCTPGYDLLTEFEIVIETLQRKLNINFFRPHAHMLEQLLDNLNIVQGPYSQF